MRSSFLPTVAFAALAAPALAGETVSYSVDGAPYEGYFAAAENARGLVLVIHDWDGLTDYERRRADMLAELGYDAFAVDIYGADVRPTEVDHKRALTGELRGDRDEMRARLAGSIQAARAASDAPGMVAMGYCFGGGATLEMARAMEVDGVVGYATFHGGLSTPAGQSWSGEVAPILVAHGGADSSITMSDVATFAKELEAVGATYEIQVYSGAPHAFTVFGSDRYRERADEESWDAFTDFLSDRFSE